jgi:hypothetical protein
LSLITETYLKGLDAYTVHVLTGGEVADGEGPVGQKLRNLETAVEVKVHDG